MSFMRVYRVREVEKRADGTVRYDAEIVTAEPVSVTELQRAMNSGLCEFLGADPQWANDVVHINE